MRKIIGSLFQSLDGVIQAPGGPEEDQTGFAHGGWVFPYFDDSLDEPMGRLLGGSYESIETRPTAALRVNGCAHPTTGLKQIWTRALGPLASSSPWLIVRRHRRCSTPTGSRRSTKGIHS